MNSILCRTLFFNSKNFDSTGTHARELYFLEICVFNIVIVMRSCLSSIVFSTVVLLSMSALTECSSRSNFPEVLGSAMPWFGTERRGAPNNISRDRRWGLRGQKKGRREAQMASVVAQFEDVDDSGEAVAEEHPL